MLDQSHKDRVIDPHLIQDTCKTDRDLALVNESWPDLPEAIRAGILAMVKAARSARDTGF
jgi:hypothetical protein